MKQFFFSLTLLLIGNQMLAQDSLPKSQSVETPFLPKTKYNQRVKIVVAGNFVTYTATTVALYKTWYKNYPQSSFHFFNDNREWLQVDKAGHAWSAYSEGRLGIAVWRWAGLPDKKSIWLGGLSGLAYQSIIEVLDGFSAEWGFSWGDYLANTFGSGLLISQELGWKDQRIQLKFFTHINNYSFNKILNARANNIYGTSIPDRLLKDYNAQTYWLSMNIKSFLRQSDFPGWLNIAVGYGADGMYGAVNNLWTDKNRISYNYSDIKRYRQFYLSPDIDFTKIKTKSKFLRTSLFLLNSFKLPAPSIILSNNKLKWSWLQF